MLTQNLPFLIFSLTWMTAVTSPGPNFVLVTATSTSESRSAGLFVALGISLASALWGVIGYTGVTFVIASHEWAYLLIKLLGGSYLIWIGYKLLISSFTTSTATSTANPKKIKGVLAAIWAGFFTNIANPKTVIFVASLFSSFQLLMANPLAYLCIPIMMLVSLLWHSSVAIARSSLKMMQFYFRIRPWFDRIAGIVLISYGLNFSFHSAILDYFKTMSV